MIEALGFTQTGRAGVDLPEMVDGLPVDRTICPRCLSLDHIRGTCAVCGGKPVCPTCRNGRVMSMAGPNLGYRVCPDCCFSEDGFSPTGIPNWLRNPAGREAAVQRYLAARRQERVAVFAGVEDDDDAPF